MRSGTLPKVRFAYLLGALLLLFVSSAFLLESAWGRRIEGLLIALVLLTSLFAARGRWTLLLGGALAGLTVIGQWIYLSGAPGAAGWLYLVPFTIFVALVIVRLLHHVLTAKDVDFETLCASMAGFLMIGVLAASCYLLLERVHPGHFAFSQPGQTMDGFNAFYLSFVTLSTIGFGDITPVSRAARMLAVMEGITGMFYVAILVARLVSIHTAKFVSSRE